MDQADFLASARFIAKNNLTDRVKRVVADFDERTGHLSVRYCVDGDPTDEDWEECELTCGELAAEFPEIRTAETDCRDARGCDPDERHVVFARGND